MNANGHGPPQVSIVIPAFNRATFLCESLQSVNAQSFRDWELIVVDDGSSDETDLVVQSFAAGVHQSVRYLRQENQGPGVARQTGISACAHEFVAFMDSDDPWLPHHLEDSVRALREHPDLDLVVAPARTVDIVSGKVVHENSQIREGRLREKYRVQCRRVGDLKIVDDESFLDHVIRLGFPGGIQATVLRRSCLGAVRMRPYSICEDHAFFIDLVSHGAQVGFFSKPHIVYQIHGGNVSLANPNARTSERQLQAARQIIRLYSEILHDGRFTRHQRRLLRKKVSEAWFWRLGDAVYRSDRRPLRALVCMLQGLRLEPTSWRLWRALVGHVVRPFPKVPATQDSADESARSV